MSSVVLAPQGNNDRWGPTVTDPRAFRTLGGPGPDSSPNNQRECKLALIELAAVRMGDYPSTQTAIPRFTLSWTASGRGPLHVTFDAERGGSFALTGTGFTVGAFFEHFNPQVLCPVYEFSWSSSHAFSVGRNTSIHSSAFVIPPEGTILIDVPRWAYTLRAVGSIVGGILRLHPDNTGLTTVGTFIIPTTNPAIGAVPAWLQRPIDLSSHDRFYSINNPDNNNPLRVHISFKIAV